MKQTLRNNSGFSLIEVLVTLILTSIGILGIVAMQGRSIHYTQDSVQRNAAVMLTDSLIQIMRTNPNEVFAKTTPNYPVNSEPKSNSLFYKTAGSDFNTAVGNCVTLPKTAKEQRDCWVAAAKANLPGVDNLLKSDFYICRSSVRGSCDDAGSALEIQLAWSVKEEACPDERVANATTCIYRTRVEL